MARSNYFVVSVNEGTEENPMRIAFCHSVPKNYNLLHCFDVFKGIEIVHAVDTKKEGEALAAFWNECYRKNQTH